MTRAPRCRASADKLKSVGASMTSAGQTLTTDVTVPLVGIGYAATKAASDFQAAMTQLVTQAGLPADQFKNLTAQVQAFADTVSGEAGGAGVSGGANGVAGAAGQALRVANT